jgi:hypothetical protein
MKTLWVSQKINYTGEQLRPLYNYLEHGLLGNSCVAWRGPCDVAFDHMIDGEDLRAGSGIAADEMVHFILELFDFPLKGAIVLQRLMGEMTLRTFRALGVDSQTIGRFERNGDDLYLEGKKLNISIATATTNSVLIHFAVNAKPTGAPVPILCLGDLGVEPEKFAGHLMESLAREFTDIIEASQKVRCF